MIIGSVASFFQCKQGMLYEVALEQDDHILDCFEWSLSHAEAVSEKQCGFSFAIRKWRYSFWTVKSV